MGTFTKHKNCKLHMQNIMPTMRTIRNTHKKETYHDPNLGLTTKARAWKGAGWECNSGVTFTLMGVIILVLGLQPKQRHGKMWADNATLESHSHSRECGRV
jgi:hypothetical protein